MENKSYSGPSTVDYPTLPAQYVSKCDFSPFMREKKKRFSTNIAAFNDSYEL